MVGIIGYGSYIPKLRIKVEEIASTWKKEGERISKGLGVTEKALGAFDEDSATIAVEAARYALFTAKLDAQKLGAIYVGSESHPYAVNPTASIVGDAIKAGPDYMAADLEFACKAGTAGIQICMGLVKSKMIEYGLAIGADTAQGRPGDALEFTAGSGGAAFIIGKKEESIAEINDTLDFWRRQHAEFPSHAGRFTGEPAYFKHVLNAATKIMEKNSMKAKDFDYAVFHQPNGKFPKVAAKKLGFTENQIIQGLITPFIGNTYSGAVPVGLSSILDVVNPGEKILAVSYGSGAGSDAFILTATKKIKNQRQKNSVFESIGEKEYVSYGEYIKHRRKIKSL
jgi:hydroxymethylglutaryl-CoA synthase